MLRSRVVFIEEHSSEAWTRRLLPMREGRRGRREEARLVGQRPTPHAGGHQSLQIMLVVGCEPPQPLERHQPALKRFVHWLLSSASLPDFRTRKSTSPGEITDPRVRDRKRSSGLPGNSSSRRPERQDVPMGRRVHARQPLDSSRASRTKGARAQWRVVPVYRPVMFTLYGRHARQR